MTILFGSDPQVEATDQRTIFDLCLDTHLQPQNCVTLHCYILNIYIYICMSKLRDLLFHLSLEVEIVADSTYSKS